MKRTETTIGDAKISHWADEPDGSGPTWTIVTPERLNVLVTRIPLDDGRTQLCVSINTEDVDPAEHNERGEPYLCVSINSGDVYDIEPPKPTQEVPA